VRLIDRYLLRLLVWPLVGCLGVTVIALLLERVLRLLDALSQSSARFDYVTQLAINLVPHYLGLALPVAFFVALFIVIVEAVGRLGDRRPAGQRPVAGARSPRRSWLWACSSASSAWPSSATCSPIAATPIAR
jgi:hypothetical protein